MVDRAAIVLRIFAFVDATDKSDLLDETKTHDNLLLLLMALLDNGCNFLVTSVRTDHGDDSALGPHSHSAGYAIDIYPSPDGGTMAHLLLNTALNKNPYCTKVGLGGIYRALCREGTYNGTIVFYDNDQAHIHLQTA